MKIFIRRLYVINFCTSTFLCIWIDCQTFGGNSPGDKCMFPFIWKGVTYEGCTKADNNGQAWCATSYKPGGTNIDGWTNCRDGCPMQGIYFNINDGHF